MFQKTCLHLPCVAVYLKRYSFLFTTCPQSEFPLCSMATAFFLALEYKTGSIVIEALGGCVGGGRW